MLQTTDNASKDLAERAALFFALGDETRLSIVTKLSSGQTYSIAQLTVGTPMTRQAVTKHLKVLENANLVHGSRTGRECLYAINPAPLAEMKEYLERVSRQWDDALLRLKAFAEKQE